MTGGAFVRDLLARGPGRVGVALLVILVLVALVVVVTYPRDFGSAYWGNPAYWADNPRSVPPAWAAPFYGGRAFRHRSVALTEPTGSATVGRGFTRTFDVRVSHSAAEPPTSIAVSLRSVSYAVRPPIISAALVRPDGVELPLFRSVVAGPRPGESAPYVRHAEEPLRVVVRGEGAAAESLSEHYRTLGVELGTDRIRDGFEALAFGRPDGDTVVPLHGAYVVRVELLVNSEDDGVAEVRVVAGGSVFGVMGTDALGRDLAVGLLYGLPVALAIGLAASIVSTLIGTALGLLSGYSGGRTDLVIQRAADIVANVPVLPLLIFLVFIGGSKLWIIILVLVAFSWPGLTIMVRTMVLQLRRGPEVEAAVSLGASRFRIILRHVFPHTASYILAQLVFFTPSAILAEAGLSFLGLGDPSVPTWGQILEHGFRTGAVFLGYWWWVIPPGLLIVLTAVTFMLLALGMESIVDPRLKGARLWRS